MAETEGALVVVESEGEEEENVMDTGLTNISPIHIRYMGTHSVDFWVHLTRGTERGAGGGRLIPCS